MRTHHHLSILLLIGTWVVSILELFQTVCCCEHSCRFREHMHVILKGISLALELAGHRIWVCSPSVDSDKFPNRLYEIMLPWRWTRVAPHLCIIHALRNKSGRKGLSSVKLCSGPAQSLVPPAAASLCSGGLGAQQRAGSWSPEGAESNCVRGGAHPVLRGHEEPEEPARGRLGPGGSAG